MNIIKTGTIGILLLWSCTATSAVNDADSVEANVRLMITDVAGVGLQLEVRQAPLAKVLDSMTSQTGIRINYSILPEGLVTATCAGPFENIMACLLDGEANFVFRYDQQPTHTGSQRQPLEAWVLGAKIENHPVNASVCSSVGIQPNTPQIAETTPHSPPDLTAELIQMASSDNPEERIEAVGRLLAGGRKGDVTVKETLEAALSDEDARVRARAISSLAHREGAGARAALYEALYDSDVSVRLTAVGNAGADITLLKQALNDSDERVRQFAGIKLRPLLNPEGPS